jgi:hypothetical protein
VTVANIRVRRGLVVLVAAVACIGAPFEHSNYWDAASGSRIEIGGAPDTLYSILDTFELTVTSSPAFPTSIGGAAMTFVEGRTYLSELGGFRFVPSGINVVFPRMVTFAAHVNPVKAWPVDTVSVWMIQRAQTLALSCFSVGCQSIAGTSTAVALITGTDEGGGGLVIPVTIPAFGTATSSDTLVMRVIGRTGARITMVGVAPGVATLQISAGGLLATLPIAVTP